MESNVPTLFELHEPFPNPFNPKTKIAFNTTNDAKIELVIFDINGRLVREFDISGRSPVTMSLNGMLQIIMGSSVNGCLLYTIHKRG